MTCTSNLFAVGIVLACTCLAAAQTTKPSAAGPAPASQPASLDQVAQQGSDALAAGDAPAAIKAFTALSQAQPNNTGALLGLAEAYLKDKNPLQAVEIYNRCRKLSPTEWRAEYGLGTIYLQMNYYPLAKPFLERALMLAPNQPQARGRVAYNLALCYRGLHQMTEAINLARQTLALDPTNADGRRLLISLYVDTNRMDDALAEAGATIDSIRAALAKTPDDRLNTEQLLQVLGIRADLLRAMIAAKPADPSFRLQLADTFEQMAQADQLVTYHNAIEQVDAALKKAPENPDVLFAHGRLQYLLGRTAGAVDDLQAVLKIAPTDTRAKQLLEKIQAASTRPVDK